MSNSNVLAKAQTTEVRSLPRKKMYEMRSTQTEEQDCRTDRPFIYSKNDLEDLVR